MLISDVGDVLLATHPDAHYRALAELTGLPLAQVRKAIETAGLPARFEHGELDGVGFAEQLRAVLSAPHLPDTDPRRHPAALATPELHRHQLRRTVRPRRA